MLPARRLAIAALLLTTLAMWTLILYWPALPIRVVGDGWVLLQIGSRGFVEAAKAQLSYHTIPVTHLFDAALWRLFGWRQGAYQLLNLMQLGLLGATVYALGARLLRNRWVAAVGSLLFIANASFYEIPCWPIVGNFQSFAALLYAGGMLAALSAIRSGRLGWTLLFVLAGTSALLTYEPALSVVPAALMAAWLSSGESGEGRSAWRPRLRALLPLVVAAVLCGLGLLAAKAALMSGGDRVAFLPENLDAVRFRLFYMVRGCIAMFSLRGADSAVTGVFKLGFETSYGTSSFHVLLGLWLAALAGCFWALISSRRPLGVRCLAWWFAIHMVIITAATTPVSRHFLLPAMPASLLAAWLLVAGARWLAAWISPRVGAPPELAAIALTLITVACLALGAKTDIDKAARAYRASTAAWESVRELVTANQNQTRFAFVDMPSTVGSEGVGAYAFENGLGHLLNLLTGKDNAEIYALPERQGLGKLANGTRPIHVAALRAMAEDPAYLVLRFDPQLGRTVALDAESLTIPAAYTQSTAPYLPWRPGAWPWMAIRAGEELRLPVACGADCWIGLHYLREPRTHFSVAFDGAAGQTFAPRPVATPYWPSAAVPAGAVAGSTTVTLKAHDELWLAGLWAFAPPTSYSPSSAPFLSWLSRPHVAFLVWEPLTLPLRAVNCEAGCALEIEYLAGPGRELAVGVGGRTPLALPAQDAPAWRVERLAMEPAELWTVVLEPGGPQAALVGRLAVRPVETAPLR